MLHSDHLHEDCSLQTSDEAFEAALAWMNELLNPPPAVQSPF